MSTRVAIVTGGAQGIGRAIALRLAADGLDVAVADLSSKTEDLAKVVAEIQKLGRRSLSIICDVAKEEEVKALVENTVSELGQLDVMVANAGILARSEPFAEATLSKWESTLNVNVIGTMLCYKYAAQQMIKQGNGGRIVGASSLCGKRGFAGLGPYCMSKAAIRSMTQTASLELAKHGITVNAYAPGMIETSMTTHPLDEQLGRPCAASLRLLGHPDAPVGQPEDIARTVSFITSPDSGLITGQSISVNGGTFFD